MSDDDWRKGGTEYRLVRSHHDGRYSFLHLPHLLALRTTQGATNWLPGLDLPSFVDLPMWYLPGGDYREVSNHSCGERAAEIVELPSWDGGWVEPIIRLWIEELF